jgi:hypothetical protein
MNNLSTRFPDAPKLDTVLVTRVGPGSGYAFGVATDGLTVFISSSLARRLGVMPGDRVEGSIVPNRAKPEATPWYLTHGVVTVGGAQREADEEAVLDLLGDAGGAWEAHQLAEDLDLGDAGEIRVTVAMESAHLAGKVSKIVLFDHTSEARRVWYTAYPDRIDVDEFDDSEGDDE